MHADQTTCSFPVNISVPQGSVFGPLGFAAYTEDVADIINRQSVLFQLYADDSCMPARGQTTSRASSTARGLRRRLRAVVRLATSPAERRQNGELLVGSRANITKLATQDQSLRISSETIKRTTVVRDLGVLLDSEISMKHHVTNLVTMCHYHLRRLRQIRRRVGVETTTRLVLAMITSRLDYCNSVLAGLPQSTLNPLQNATARVIFDVGKQEHVSPYLEQLHWLPVRARVQFKLCTLMNAIHNKRCPASLVLQLVGMASTRWSPFCGQQQLFSIPRLNTRVGERAFS